MDSRPAIRSTLWSCAAAAGVSTVAAAMWVVLGTLGDEAGSQASRGIMLVSLVCLAIGLATLVVLLALAELGRSPGDSSDRAVPRTPPSDVDPTAV
jgi:hypothetical protein